MLTEKHFIFTDIRFLISPECLLTFLLYEPLSENVNEFVVLIIIQELKKMLYLKMYLIVKMQLLRTILK